MKWMQFFTPAKSIDFHQTREMIETSKSDEITVLDVRQPKEYQQSHIPGAMLIPLPELGDRVSEIDRDKPVLVYCAVGGRSRVAAQMLSGKGFKTVYNVSGGIRAYQAKTAVGPQDQGLSLFSPDQPAEEVLKVAYSLEQGLEEFYLSMADQAENETVRDVFVKLAGIEVKHMDALVKAYRSLGHDSISQADFSDQVTDRALEGGMTTLEYLDLFAPDLGSPVDVISLAMSIEAQALDLYQRLGARLENADARAMILKIADEEKLHLKRLGQLMDQMEN